MLTLKLVRQKLPHHQTCPGDKVPKPVRLAVAIVQFVVLNILPKLATTQHLFHPSVSSGQLPVSSSTLTRHLSDANEPAMFLLLVHRGNSAVFESNPNSVESVVRPSLNFSSIYALDFKLVLAQPL